jgi:molecular chaperone GrpE (heat shock protein)
MGALGAPRIETEGNDFKVQLAEEGTMAKTHFDEEREKHSRQGPEEPAGNRSETTPNPTDTVRDLTAAWASRGLEALQLEATVQLRMFTLLEKVVSQGAEILVGIGRTDGSIANLSQRLDIIEGRLESLESGIQRGWQQGAEILRAIAVLEKNLQQARVLVERTADRVDRLSEGFVEREVKEPLLRDIGGIYHALQEAMLNESDGIRSVAEYARAILESRGVSLIEPERGDRFNPGEHRPIESIFTTYKSMEGRVAKLCRMGLRFNGKVIQQAWVGLYTTQQKET